MVAMVGTANFRSVVRVIHVKKLVRGIKVRVVRVEQGGTADSGTGGTGGTGWYCGQWYGWYGWYRWGGTVVRAFFGVRLYQVRGNAALTVTESC